MIDIFDDNPNKHSYIPLSVHVSEAIERYFKELDGQYPTNLYETILHEVEKPLLEAVLIKTHGNQTKSAQILGLNRGTLRKKLELYNLV